MRKSQRHVCPVKLLSPLGAQEWRKKNMIPRNFRHWCMMLYYTSPCLSIGWPDLHNGISPSVCMSAIFMCTVALEITSVTKLQVPLKINDFNFQGFKCPVFPSHWWTMNDLYVWNGDLLTNHIGVKKTPAKSLVTFTESGMLLSNTICAINGYLHISSPTSHSLCL